MIITEFRNYYNNNNNNNKLKIGKKDKIAVISNLEISLLFILTFGDFQFQGVLVRILFCVKKVTVIWYSKQSILKVDIG